MRNKLLMTTALTAIFLSTNVYAKTINKLPEEGKDGFQGYLGTSVDGDNVTIRDTAYNTNPEYLTADEITIDNVYIQTKYKKEDGKELGLDVGKKVNDGSALTKRLVLRDGARLDIDRDGKNHDKIPEGYDVPNLFNISEGGSVEIEHSELHADGIVNMTGGEMTLQGGEFTVEDPGARLNISGGTINFVGDSQHANAFSIEISDPNEEGIEEAYGPIDMTGGTIHVQSGQAGSLSFSETNNSGNYIAGTQINIKGGELNINENAGLTVAKGFQERKDPQHGDLIKGIINLTDAGVINLGGTLRGNITGDDRGKIYFQNSSAQIDGDVDTPSLIFENSHALSKAITGKITDVDTFEIKKGTMLYDKEFEGSATNVIVGEGATLDIGANTLHSGGDVGEDDGVVFKDNSTLKFTVTDQNNYGKIFANYVQISENGTTLDMTLNGAALAKGDKMTLQLFNLEDVGDYQGVEIEGKFANLSTNSRYKFTDNGDGTFEVASIGSATDAVVDAGGSANNAETAEAWDSVSASGSSPVAAAVTEKLADLSNKTYVEALTAIAPEVSPMVEQTQSETAAQVFGAVSTRLSGGSVSSGSQGMSSGDSVFERAAAWVQGLYNKSKLDDTSKSKGFDSDTKGVAFGLEKYLTEDVKAGIGYSYSQTDIDGFMRDTDVDTHTAILYGEYKPSNWFVNGIATYGWSDYEEKKNVGGVNVKADYDVETLGLQLMTGYDMNFNALNVTPEAGLRYVRVDQDSYKDGADQRVSGHTSDIITGVIGAKVSKDIALNNGLNLKPEARLAATYDLETDKSNAVVTLANGSAYKVNGEGLDRFGVELGAGLTAELNDKVEVTLGYEGKFRDDYQDHSGILSAKYKF